MPDLTPEARRIVDEIAARHGVGSDAALVLLTALAAGNGDQAQFSHPDLGGMGQWSRGGMVMLGDMFNHGLKARVDALCTELAGLLRDATPFAPTPGASRDGADHPGVGLFAEAGDRSAGHWPAELGAPAFTGARNDLRYAVFPATRRLAVDQGGRRRIFDTADHRIGGVSQQQGGDRSLSFTSQHGLVRPADLVEVTAQ